MGRGGGFTPSVLRQTPGVSHPPFFDKRGKVYALALQEGLRFPFQARDELAAPAAAASAPQAASVPSERYLPVRMRISFSRR